MRPRPRAAALAVLTSTAALLSVLVPVLAATPAQAATGRVEDPAGDVEVVDRDAGEVPGTSDRRTADIRSVTAVHSRTVSVRITVADLKPRDELGAFARFVVPSGESYLLTSSSGVEGDQPALFRDGTQVGCGSLRALYDATDDLITLRLGRSCLDDPRSFAWGAGVAAFTPGGTTLVDDARRNGNPPPSGPDRLRVAENLRFG